MNSSLGLHKITRTPRALLALGCLLLILGVGNLVFANYKYRQYSEIVSAAQAGLARPYPRRSKAPVFISPLSADKQSEHIQRLLVRLDFYSFVKLGGQVVSVLGGILLLIYLFIRLPGLKSSAP